MDGRRAEEGLRKDRGLAFGGMNIRSFASKKVSGQEPPTNEKVSGQDIHADMLKPLRIQQWHA